MTDIDKTFAFRLGNIIDDVFPQSKQILCAVPLFSFQGAFILPVGLF
jgi:hypothetical protein